MLKTLVIINLENNEERNVDISAMKPADVRSLFDEAEGRFLFVFLSENKNEKAVIVCPGGGFKQVNIQHEGFEFAEWFAERGFTLAVLKYALPEGRKESPITDITNACARVRAGVGKEKYTKVGCMGASIGGYLAIYGGVSGLADFNILMYPVVSMEDWLTHKPSRELMFGADPASAEAETFSLQHRVNGKTAPAFIVVSEDDPAVNPKNSLIYASNLMQKKIPVSLHIYPEGGHGFGFNDSYQYKKVFLLELDQWLQSI